MKPRLSRPAPGTTGIRLRSSCAAGALLCALSAAPAAAADPEALYEAWRWRGFTTEAGLSSDAVHDVVETAAGTVWASTSGGLAWYDGYRWHPVGEAAGLPPGRVEALLAVDEDRLLAVAGGDLYRGGREGFQRVPFDAGDGPARLATVLPFPGGGALVVASGPIGTPAALHRYRDGAMQRFPTPAPPPSSVIPQVWSTGDDAIWINTRAGLQRWRDGRWSRQLEAPTEISLSLTRLVEGADGTGLAIVDYPPAWRGLWEWSRGRPPAHTGVDRLHLVDGMDVAASGEAIVVYVSGTVEVRDRGEWTALDHPPPQLDNVLFVRFRDDGDLWVGTKRGLFLLRRSLDLWTHWAADGAGPGNLILEILRAADGSVWAGTADGIRIRRPGGDVERIETIGDTALNEVTGLAEDADGHIWIGSGSSFAGAYRWDGREWRHFGPADGLGAQRIHRIRRDRRGGLWFLGVARVLDRKADESEPGAFLYSEGRFEPWGTEQGLIHSRVYAFAESADGSRWFGTLGGLSRWKDGEWTHWTTGQGLAFDKVFVLAVDGEDRLWFGHQERGLGFLEEGRPRYVTRSDGLVNDEVWDLGADGEGALWVSTREGLCRHRGGLWSCFGRGSGLGNESLWPLHVSGRQVYVGTLGSGVTTLDLSVANRRAPRVLLAEPIVEAGSVLLRWNADAYWGELPPAEIETRHRLGDGPWSGWSKSRELTLSGLSPGAYGFRVQAKGPFGDVDPSGAGASFAISPPFHRRPEFVAPVALLAIAVLGLAGLLLARRRAHAAALRASERKYRTIFENVQDAFFRTDREGRFIEISPSVKRHLGATRDEMLGTRLRDHAVAPEDADALLERTLAASQVEDRELEMRCRDGRRIFASVSVHVLRDDRNEPIGFEGILRDVSERKEAQAVLQRSQQELERRVGERTRELADVNAALRAEVTERRAAVRALRESERELRELSRKLIKAREEERRRLARDLHDGLNQRLALFAMQLQRLGQEPPGSAAGFSASTRALWEQTTELCAEVQRLAYQLHPSKLEELGLVTAARSFCEEIAGQSGIRIDFVARDVPDSIPSDVALCLYRVMQESLANVVKHSGAREARVELSVGEGSIRLQVTDSGVGFDPETTTRKGLGLLSMRERLQLLGGDVDIESKPAGGTSVGARVPYSRVVV